jgi:hypothetical protein
VSILEILAVFATLYVRADAVEDMGCYFSSIDEEASSHLMNKEAFLGYLHLPGIDAKSKIGCQLVSIAVEPTPYIELVVWSFVVLVSLYPA